MDIFVEFILSVHREMSKSVENCLPTSYSNRPNQANSLKIFWAPVQSINTSLLNALEYSCKTNNFLYSWSCLPSLISHPFLSIFLNGPFVQSLLFWSAVASGTVWLQVSGRAKAVQRHGRNWQFVHTGCSKQRSCPFSLWSRETLMEKKHAVDALRFIRSLFEFWISHSFLWHVYVNLPNQIFMGIFSRRVTFWLVFAIGTMWELKARVGSGSFLDLLDFIMPDIEVEKYW